MSPAVSPVGEMFSVRSSGPWMISGGTPPPCGPGEPTAGWD